VLLDHVHQTYDEKAESFKPEEVEQGRPRLTEEEEDRARKEGLGWEG
jgi:hypothetical protein